MVVIHVKADDNNQFLYETTCDTGNDTLIRELVGVWNKRLQIAALAQAARALAEFGPMKAAGEQGIDDIQSQMDGNAPTPGGEHYRQDPTGQRTGHGVGPQLTEVIEKVCVDAEAAISAQQAKQRQALDPAVLEDKVTNIRGALTMAYPMGLPAWDTASAALEGVEALDGTAVAGAIMDPDTATLWVASREFDRNDTVGDRLGKNEKTKVVAKLVKAGGGAPAREPAINEEERKAMMAHYFKKQEEQKSMAEAQDDDYLASSWADPKGMQKGLRGLGRSEEHTSELQSP